MYTVNHLSYDYPTRSELHDISVEFPTNKITAIICPNGCGKSTLLKHLSKSIYSKGTITLNDEPLESIDSSRFAKFVSILSPMHDAMID
ncbi:ATP-binding cassette domain-containing protein, partial [Veillonella atypica]|uniref:ATP-binding cassette domain-containing protein n=1 Tax=Veillonella atypica TaxID=39777 RepID=UPI0023AF6C38